MQRILFTIAAAVTIFTGAFLLFQIQPLISKAILPWFGGSPSVWSTCMLFFQVGLLGGYWYAHSLTERFTPRWQAIIHMTLLAVACCMMPILPREWWEPKDGQYATYRILAVLAGTVGLPYFLLSATGPLVQAWFRLGNPGADPYRLYSLSNVGSFAALLSYPFFFEPRLALNDQGLFWAVTFYAFVASIGILAIFVSRSNKTVEEQSAKKTDESAEQPGVGIKLGWLALPAVASIALLSVTNHLTQDMAPVPFLWVIPLSLYLMTFIISFERSVWYVRWFFCPLVAFMVLLLAAIHGHEKLDGMTTEFAKKLLPQRVAKDTDQEIADDGDEPIIENENPQVSKEYKKFLERPFSYSLEYAINGATSRVLGAVRWMTTKRPVEGAEQEPADEWDFEFKASSFSTNAIFQSIFYLIFLFAACMVCHGELYRIRPSVKHLTRYYRMIAAGGAMGGVFVALVCPITFNWYAELPISLAASFVLASCTLAATFLQAASNRASIRNVAAFVLLTFAGLCFPIAFADRLPDFLKDTNTYLAIGGAIVGALMALGLAWKAMGPAQQFAITSVLCLSLAGCFGSVLGVFLEENEPGSDRARGFFGVIKMRTGENPPGKSLVHGTTQHGFQHSAYPLRYETCTYYAPESGIGVSIRHHPKRQRGEPMRIAVIGLGTGTIAADGQRGDTVDYYEIDPTMAAFSAKHFTYRADAKANEVASELKMGDARLTMQREEPQAYDVIAVDAFSGDAIPAHLLTKECWEKAYKKHLNRGGILAVHISNRYLELLPVCVGLAKSAGLKWEQISLRHSDHKKQYSASTWVLLTNNDEWLNDPQVTAFFEDKESLTEREKKVILWTDQYSDLFSILNLR